MFRKQFADIQDAFALAHAIVDTVREPLVVLDDELRVVAASRSFYLTFKVNRDETQGRLLFELGDSAWDIPKLRLLLGKIIPERGEMEDYEVDHDFPVIGHRIMLLNARKVFYEVGSHANIILLGIEDVTGKRALEREKDELLRQKDVLLDEIQHRVTNSLQIIASIILLKAKSVESEETRRHLHDAHSRVISVAAVQQHLHASASIGSMEMQPYLTGLCEALSQSMIGDNRSVILKVVGDGGVATCRNAESLGLIVTELVINALKHAFGEETRDGRIVVAYEVSGTDWKLSVADNGVGKPDGVFAQPKSGLGTGIVKALAKQLDAQVETVSGDQGTTVSITHATFGSKAKSMLPNQSLINDESASRTATINQAHEAVGGKLLIKPGSDQKVPLPLLVNDVIHVLHGARSRPATEAIEALRPFMNTMRDRASGTDRFADASAAAVSALVQRLETKGVATDDLWEEAIESSLSFANEAS
jgi:two-component sensor histidine kinase